MKIIYNQAVNKHKDLKYHKLMRDTSSDAIVMCTCEHNGTKVIGLMWQESSSSIYDFFYTGTQDVVQNMFNQIIEAEKRGDKVFEIKG